MRVGYLAGAILSLVLSLGCVGWTVVGVIRVQLSMGSLAFWAAVGCHFVTALIALVLLEAAILPKGAAKEEQS
jgi:hypothetical protein